MLADGDKRGLKIIHMSKDGQPALNAPALGDQAAPGLTFIREVHCASALIARCFVDTIIQYTAVLPVRASRP